MPLPSPRKLIVNEGPSAGQAYPLELAEITLGRDPGAQIVLDSQGVSRRHARLILQQDQYTVEDLGSSNGTFVNGERLAAPRRLKPGDVIALGRAVTLVYQAEPPPGGATMLETPGAGSTMLESAMPDGTLMDAGPARPAAQTAQSVRPPAQPARQQPAQPPGGTTIIGEEPALPAARQTPPQLVVAIAGEAVRTYQLTQPRVAIGRAEDNQIIVGVRIVSRHHAVLEREMRAGSPAYRLTVLPEASNPVLLQGRPLEQPHLLRNGDTLRIGSLDPGMMVSITYVDASQPQESAARSIAFGEKALVQIGRDPTNDIVLDSPNVSRFHAQIERVGSRHRLRDLRSANGTFVNDQRVEGEAWLQPNDVIRVGRHRFAMGADRLGELEETSGLRVDAVGLNKWIKKDVNILQNISLVFKPREFIAVVGQSGGGKSTLVDSIAGYRPATHGQVLVNGTNVYKNFDAIRNDIGYVPQRDIIHTELTVYQALEYAARLRMPGDTSAAERRQRITEVLNDLDLAHRKDTQISKLSGGQIKRVSIGVELLTQPGLFFLDEPTSGLDPGTETAFMHLMRRLADQGRTIILVTHATKNVMLADKVVFLARGGYLAWFGPPEEALRYFDQFRTERERREREMEFDQIYAILDDQSRGKAQDWAKRFMEHPAYQTYIVKPLQSSPGGAAQFMSAFGAPAAAGQPAQAAPRLKKKTRTSGLRQFFVLSQRNLTILIKGRTSLLLMLLVPLLIGGLDFVIGPLMGRDTFDFFKGDAANAATTLFLLTVNMLLVAGLSQMREFVKEADIYKRERMVNLQILPYVSSKVWVALLLAFYQGAIYTGVRFLAFNMPGGPAEFGMFYITMVLAVMAGMMGGLLASALAPSPTSAPMIVILLLVPQIVLSGALAPVPDAISQIASTRWAFQAFIGITGIGSDVAADACWKLDENLRDSMTLEDKEAAGCRCMGTAIFKPGSCNFPGLGEYYAPELDEAAPLEPAELGPRPPDPVIPPAPERPSDPNNQVAMVQYLNALKAYQDEATLIQDKFRSDMQLYEAQADIYKAQITDYQEARLKYEGARKKAIDSAEGVIESVSSEFDWAFVDKRDPAVFIPWLARVWGAQGVLSVVYFFLILLLIKRKDG